jgi:CRP/FNR family cyclic AMP-dependent transcriptional regulator
VLLSAKLLDELRQHWQRLRRKPSVWLFPGERSYTSDQPITPKVIYHGCKRAAQRAGLPSVPASTMKPDDGPSQRVAHKFLCVNPICITVLFRTVSISLSVPFCGMPTADVSRAPAKVSPVSKKAASHSRAFSVKLFLNSISLGKTVATFKRKGTVFSQGDSAINVYYIQKGSVKLTVVNESGREAVVAILGSGDFFGESCLATESISAATATAVMPTTLLVIQKKEMIRVLRAEHKFSDHFIAYMLGRNIRVEQDLLDQLFNSSEKRLARTLLIVAKYGKQDQPEKMIANLSQETLAGMIGTTRSRVSFFMNKFRKLGFIRYSKRDVYINKSLLSVILQD